MNPSDKRLHVLANKFENILNRSIFIFPKYFLTENECLYFIGTLVPLCTPIFFVHFDFAQCDTKKYLRYNRVYLTNVCISFVGFALLNLQCSSIHHPTKTIVFCNLLKFNSCRLFLISDFRPTFS